MSKFTSFLAPLMQAYVFYRKASGYWDEASYEPNLVLFDRHCKKYPTEFLSQEMMHGLMAIFSLGAPKLFIGLNPPNFLNNSSSVIFYSK